MRINPIERYLAATGLSQQQLARLTGFAPPTLSEWRRDLKHPSVHLAFRLEKATKGRIPASSWAGRELRRGREVTG